MSASLRGHQGVIKLFYAGQDTKIVTITKAEVHMDSNFQRSYYVGRNLAEGDQTMDGWSGNIECEVKDSTVDDMIDSIVTNNLNGIGVQEVTMVLTENYADGKTRSYVYFDIQMKMSKTQPSMNEKMTKRLEWQCSGRLPL